MDASGLLLRAQHDLLAFFIGTLWEGTERDLSYLEWFARIPVIGIAADFTIDVLGWCGAWYKVNVKYPLMYRTLEKIFQWVQEVGLLHIVTKAGRWVWATFRTNARM